MKNIVKLFLFEVIMDESFKM